MGCKIAIFLLSFWLRAPVSPGSHPFYLSVTDLKYDIKGAQILGMVKIFTNDLEEALYRSTGSRIDLINVADTAAVKARLADYLSQHLVISVNSVTLEYNLLGFEKEEEATWIFIETEKCGIPVKIGVTNSILCDQFPQQMNIVHCRSGESEKSSRVNCPQSQLQFEF